MPKELKRIDGVEVFASGVWNGDKYTDEDLDIMVSAFNDTKDTSRPHLKLGHNEDQKLLQKDGLPAAGWIDNLRRVGSKLIADFIDLPSKIHELISNKAYRNVSSEIFQNVTFGDNTYKRALASVSLLGANTPAVSSLSDILALYGVTDSNNLKVYKNDDKNELKKYQFDFKMEEIMPEKNEGNGKVDVVLVSKEKELKAAEAKVATYAKESKEKDDAIKEQDKVIAEFKKEAAKLLIEKNEAELDKFITELQGENLVTPAMKPYVKVFLSEEKKEYTFEKDENKYNKKSLFKKILELHNASEVNLDEGSDQGKKEDKSDNGQTQAIAKYAKENKLSFRDAYVEVMNNNNNK